MIDFNFYGPFHFDEFIETDKKGVYKHKTKDFNQIDVNVRGIYIWGFMYESTESIKKGNRVNRILKDPVKGKQEFNPAKMQFVPYYVGKSESSIFSRIRQHQDFQNEKNVRSDAHKYIRFSKKYMKEYFKDDSFPIDKHSPTTRTELKKLIGNLGPNKVMYHNNAEILEAIYGQEPATVFSRMLRREPRTNNPIVEDKLPLLVNGNEIEDTLHFMASKNENFWFCFLPIKDLEYDLKFAETYTFYCLKGKTVSHTGGCPEVQSALYQTTDLTNTGIFKMINNSFAPSEKFEGY